PRSRFFLAQVLLVGLGGDPQDDVADRELGGAEQGGSARTDQGTRQLEEVLLRGPGDGLGQLAGLGFLAGGERGWHGGFSDVAGGFLDETPFPRLVYKLSANLRDAHTCSRAARLFSCFCLVLAPQSLTCVE